MAGQMIVLPGVTAAAGSGAPRVSMNAPDTIAAKMLGLKNVVSARSLALLPGGGVSGRCRATGLPLIPRGAASNTLGLYDIAGRTGLGLSSGGAGALGLPADSIPSSFTLVMAVALSATDIASGVIVNLLSGFDGSDVYTNMLARYYGSMHATLANKIRCAISTGGTVADTAMAAGAWAIVVIDFDNTSKKMSIAVNQVSTFSAVTMATANAPGAGSYIEIGYHADSNGLRNSKVGDLYTFSDSLLKTDLGKSQLAELVAALKTYYSIA